MLFHWLFPDRLKIAKVIPLFKAGDINQLSNYRPISLLPSISKIFEKAIYCRIYNYLNAKGLLQSHQYGFRKYISTSVPISNLTNQILKSLDRSK